MSRSSLRSSLVSAAVALAAMLTAGVATAQRGDDVIVVRDTPSDWYQGIRTGQLCRLDLNLGPAGRLRGTTLNCVTPSRTFLGGLRDYLVKNAVSTCTRQGVCTGAANLVYNGDSFDYGSDTYVLTRGNLDRVVPDGQYVLYGAGPGNAFYHMTARTNGRGVVILQRADGTFRMQCDEIVGTCIDPTNRMWPMGIWVNPANPFEVRLGFRKSLGANYNVWYTQAGF